MATTRVTHSKGACLECEKSGVCRKCGWCETDGLHWEKTAEGPVLMNVAGEKHRCTSAPARISGPPPVTVPASAPVHPDWIPAPLEKWICTFEHTHSSFATWVHEDNVAHGIPWTACDEHVPRLSPSTESVHPDWIHESVMYLGKTSPYYCTFPPHWPDSPSVHATWVHKDTDKRISITPFSACDEHVPRINVPAPDNAFTGIEPEPVTPLPEYDGTFIGPQKAELIHSLKLGMHCMLTGPTATGKSLCAIEAFAHVDPDRPVFILEGAESLRESDLIGSVIPFEGHFMWVDAMVTRAMRAGGFLFLDEFNRFNSRTQNIMLGIISRGVVVLTENGSEEVKAAEGFQVVAAMNLGKRYIVNARDPALMSRFDCKLTYTYLPSAQEERLLISKAGIDAAVARKMVKVANETRKLRKERQLEAEIDPRGLFAWARKCKAHGAYNVKTMVQAAEVTWMLDVAGTDADGYLHEENAGTLRSLIEAHS